MEIRAALFAFSRVSVADTVQVTGATSPTSGVGLELGWLGATARALAFNRDLGTYQPFQLAGLTVTVSISGSTVATFNAAGLLLEAGKSLKLQGGTSGVVTLQTQAAAGNYVITLPNANGVGALWNDGNGNTVWDPDGLGSSIGVGRVAAQVNFGAASDFAEVTVAAAWASPVLSYVCAAALPTTTDHDAEDALLEELQASVIAIAPGVSITLGVHAPNGSWGRYDFIITGVS